MPDDAASVDVRTRETANSLFVSPNPIFRILPNRIEPEDPEVTQAMRLRRHLVLEKHRDLIEDMYRTA